MPSAVSRSQTGNAFERTSKRYADAQSVHHCSAPTWCFAHTWPEHTGQRLPKLARLHTTHTKCFGISEIGPVGGATDGAGKLPFGAASGAVENVPGGKLRTGVSDFPRFFLGLSDGGIESSRGIISAWSAPGVAWMRWLKRVRSAHMLESCASETPR